MESKDNFRQNIVAVLKKERPNLTDSSLVTYSSILHTISKKIDQNNTDISIFENYEPILELLKDLAPASRKTRLSALFVITGQKIYREQMLEDCKISNDASKEQKKTAKQEESWITMKEVKDIYEHFFKNTTQILSQKQGLNYNVIVNYFLLACLGGVAGIPPRRSMDYAELKVKNYDVNKDNYYKSGIFHFQIYIDIKTLAPDVYKLLQKWIKINPTDYLLFGENKNKLTSPQITKRFNMLFNRKASTNILRHAFLSEKYKDIQEEMQKDASMMAHTTKEQGLYIKK
jgi:hypothetical protein